MSHKKHPSPSKNISKKSFDFFGWTDLEKHLKSAILFLSLALIFVLLANSGYFFYPSVSTKAILFFGLIEIIVALFLWLALINKRYWPRLVEISATGQKNINWPLILPSAYIGATILSTLFSVNRYNSFWGSVDYSNGLLTLLHFWGLFVVLSSVFREKSFWFWFLRLNILVGSAISLLAIYQKFMQGEIAMGTFGNPSHLSGYLLFIIFLSAVLFFWSRRKMEKIFLAGLGVLNLLALFLTTDIRGSQLGFVVGIGAALLAYFLSHPKKNVRRITTGLISIVLISGIFLFVSLISSGKIYSLFVRSETVKTRVTNWKIGFRGFLEKPLFGYGPENYHIPFEKYFDLKYYHQQSAEYGFNLPHNKFVEVAVLNGTLGLLTYLALFLGILWLLYKKFLYSHDKSTLALLGMWTAYLAHLFFLFDNISSFFMFFSLLAFTHFVLKEPEMENKNAGINLNPLLAYVFLVTIVIGTGGALYFFSYQTARANIYAMSAIKELENNHYADSLAALEKMENRGFFYINQKTLFELSRKIEDSLILVATLNDSQKLYIEKIVAKNEASLASDSGQLYYYLPMSRVLSVAGKFDKNNYEKSNALLQKMIAKGTKRMEAYMYQAENYQSLGQNDQAIKLGEKAIAIDPTYGFADYLFARIYRLMGDNDQAIRYIDLAMKNGYYAPAIYYLYADTANAQKDFDRLIVAFTAILKIAPDEPQNYANLAMAYFEKKDYLNSREISEQLIRKFPKLREQVQNFIHKIPQ